MTSLTSMAKQSPSSTIIISSIALLLLLSLFTAVEGAKKSSYGLYEQSNNESVKLFVFGDSYVDTGNFVHSRSYKSPSGITYPGQPAGRFCDGRVLTDYIASYLKIETPVANAFRNSSNMQNGVNFAYGGTGLFPTLVDGPNMTVQIDSFEQLVQQNVFTNEELASSIALVNAGANDYTKHITNGSVLDLPEFTESLVKQMSTNIARIHSLGVGKVAVTLLPPIGCLPALNVITDHKYCIDLLNKVAIYHTKKLQDSLNQMNQGMQKPVFLTLDLYNAFLSTLAAAQKARETNSTLMNPLEQCCKAKLGHECGNVDDQGNKLYTLCDNPGLAYFWDIVHPAQNGWNAIYNWLQPSLAQLTQ